MKKLANIETHFTDWYQDVIYEAELSDKSPVRGCMVVKPYATDMWEIIKTVLDSKIKNTGAKNTIFPLLIPQSFLKKEADHVEGFAPELAIVTHAGGKKLEEPLVVRPTSETMVHYMFAQWIKSYRDLPLKINQWANVMRWEMRPRAFLRTSEFFWQEGHTAHETYKQALQTTEQMIHLYQDFVENYLAIPVIVGVKSELEKFPGAQKTYTFEAIMPDGKALQMGTSHLLSQNFSKAFDIKFQNKDSKMEYPWLTSWGTTTRLIGAMIMTHGDQKGLVLPPLIAPIQVVIIPIYKNDATKETVKEAVDTLKKEISSVARVHVDDDQHKKPGSKFFHWELKGVPFRIEIGPRDLEKQVVVVTSRLGQKMTVPFDEIKTIIEKQLQAFQKELYHNAKNKLETKITLYNTLNEILSSEKNTVAQSGFCGNNTCESLLKKHKLSIRCLLQEKNQLNCFGCSALSSSDCIIAKSY